MAEMAGSVQKFRALHERDGAFIIPNPWDLGNATCSSSSTETALTVPSRT